MSSSILKSEEIAARQTDLRNILIILASFTAILLLVPPTRSYPVNDDWVYAQGVDALLNGTFKPLDAQAYALSHVSWGAIFVAIFGFSFTALTVSTLVLRPGLPQL